MSNLSRATINALFPEGLAWTPAAGDDYDLILDGIADNSEAVRADMNNLRYLRDPARTPILSDLEKEFAVIPVSQSTEAERRQRLAAAMFYRGTLPTYELLEQKLNDAGFNVHVWPNDPVVDPATFLTEAFQMTCGDLLPSGNEAQCGEPEAFCGQVGGELLVNGDLYVQYPHYINLCGEPDVLCGEPDAQCGLFNHILLIPIVYSIPTDAGYWPLIFFVGGDRDIYPKFGRGVFGGGNALSVRSILIQADDKIILAGGFLSCNSSPRPRIARIETNGDIDTTFTPGTGADDIILCAALQADQKIIIGGIFTNYDGSGAVRVARVDTDGTLDATFNPGTGANSNVSAVAIQADGKIIIGGTFTLYDGAAINRICRLTSLGALDAGFAVGTGLNGQCQSIAIQPVDGKVILGGVFTTYQGSAYPYIIRLNTDGSIDGAWNAFAQNMAVYAIAIQADGKIIIGGQSGIGTPNIYRLNTNGTIDGTFNPTCDNRVSSIAIQSDSKILIGGQFTTVNGVARSRIARLNTDGTLDIAFDPGTGATSGAYIGPDILALAVQTDDHILAGGYYFFYNSVLRNHITRVLENGDNDPTFNYDLSIASAYVPIERRLEFRRIILKYKPMFSWAGLIVTYN